MCPKARLITIHISDFELSHGSVRSKSLSSFFFVKQPGPSSCFQIAQFTLQGSTKGCIKQSLEQNFARLGQVLRSIWKTNVSYFFEIRTLYLGFKSKLLYKVWKQWKLVKFGNAFRMNFDFLIMQILSNIIFFWFMRKITQSIWKSITQITFSFFCSALTHHFW